VIQPVLDGSSIGETNNDFLTGDVVVHSPDDGRAPSIVWTAPTSATISDLFAAVWYAHSAVDRSNDVTLDLAATLLTSWTVSRSSNFDRSHPGTYGPNGPLSVSAGETLTLNFEKTNGQDFGPGWCARELDVHPNVTPLPAALPLFATGHGGLGLLGWRRKRKSAATIAA
jgi:hypothetical protein